MYAFAQREDTVAYDEPLYASFLARTGADHPGREEVLRLYNADGDAVVQHLVEGQHPAPVVYAKQIGKHKLGCSNSVFQHGKHVILVREPARVLLSWAKGSQPTQQELGYTALLEIVSELRSHGQEVIVVLSDELVSNPEGILRALCAKLGISFTPRMLSWPPGPKPYDGCWARYWYKGTHKSTGFSRDIQNLAIDLASMPTEFRPLLMECSAIYNLLLPLAIRPVTTQEPVSHAQSEDGHIQNRHVPSGTHAYKDDPRNQLIFIGIRDGVSGRYELVPRSHAKVSVLDSGFMMGDGVWEGLRLHRGTILFAQEHLLKLWEGATAIGMDLDLSAQGILDLVYQAVQANGMSEASGVHIRLMVTRGLKPTPYQSPYITIGKPTIVIIPEFKEAAVSERGITLNTCHVRRGAPDVQDPALNSHSKLNCISACIQAHVSGAQESLMLDPHGFVATCNSTNFFIVRSGEVWAPTGKYQMPGITRGKVLQICAEEGIPHKELDFKLTAVYSADEAFVTGTFAGLVPVRQVDGRLIGSVRAAMEGRTYSDHDWVCGPVTRRIQQLYMALKEREAHAQRRC